MLVWTRLAAEAMPSDVTASPQAGVDCPYAPKGFFFWPTARFWTNGTKAAMNYEKGGLK